MTLFDAVVRMLVTKIYLKFVNLGHLLGTGRSVEDKYMKIESRGIPWSTAWASPKRTVVGQ